MSTQHIYSTTKTHITLKENASTLLNDQGIQTHLRARERLSEQCTRQQMKQNAFPQKQSTTYAILNRQCAAKIAYYRSVEYQLVWFKLLEKSRLMSSFLGITTT